MKFRSAFDRGSVLARSFSSSSGLPYRETFERVVDPVSKKKFIKPSGKQPTYEIIQQNAKGNLISDIYARSLRGDSDAIGKVNDEMFADITRAPKSLMEAENMLIKARSIYDSLSIDDRNASGNDFNTWLSSVNDGSYFKSKIDNVKKSKEVENLKKNQPKKVFSDEQVNVLKEMFKTNA